MKNKNINNLQLLTPREVDLLLRYSSGRALRLVKQGLLPAIMLPDGQVRFDAADITSIITRREGVRRRHP